MSVQPGLKKIKGYTANLFRKKKINTEQFQKPCFEKA